MKQLVMAALWIFGIGISGCAQSLPPHEELNQAMKKSFDATGYNFASKIRVTELSIPKKQEELAEATDKRMKYLGTGLDIIQAISINLDGTVDMKTKKTEVLYDLRYEKDNVEVSVKVPLYIDYNTQTIYVGTSLFNTILRIAYPQAPETRGKLIRLNLNELLKKNAKTAPDSSDPSDLIADRFTAKNIELLNNAIHESILKELVKLPDTCFSEQSLTEQDKSTGVARHIRVDLGHKDSVAAAINIIDNVSQILFQESVITKQEYAVLLTLTDKQKLDSVIDEFNLTMTFDVGVASSGLPGRVVGQFHIADKKGEFKIGLENASTFSRFNEPQFSIKPETTETVDFIEVLSAIIASQAQDKAGSEPAPDAPANPEKDDQTPQDSSAPTPQ